MNNDIIPPRPPINVPPRPPKSSDAEYVSSEPENSHPLVDTVPPPRQESSPVQLSPAPISAQEPTAESPEQPQPPRRSHLKKAIFLVLALIVTACLAFGGWYLSSLRPLAPGNADKVRITIDKGDVPMKIAESLQEQKIIRSAYAFYLHARLTGASNKLQPGTFSLSPSESTSQIIGHLLKGNTDEYSVTFYPGATLSIAATSPKGTPSHRQVLEKIGFTQDEIDEAFATDYSKDFPLLFSDKPADADLEGYIYGQTYRVASGATAGQVLMRTFAEFEAQLQKNNLVAAFKAQNLNVYQGITLASIVQREVLAPSSSEPSGDQRQVAQVFFTRLGSGMPLGSDVTYHYAADKDGQPRDHRYESPYNTRIKAGLPPGPIASPGITALKAVGSPAPGSFVYFLSGDDDKTYFATTNEEHEANIVNHCAYKCTLP